MLHLIIGGAGCGKSTRLIGQIRKAYEQGERIYALVPEQYSFTNDLKLYEALGPTAFNAIQSCPGAVSAIWGTKRRICGRSDQDHSAVSEHPGTQRQQLLFPL